MDRRAVIGMGTLAFGAGAAMAPVRAATAAGGWRAVAEPQDAWMDGPGQRHRLVFDTSSVAAGMAAINYADTFYDANKSGYGIAPEALGVIIVLRHLSTSFGFNDAVWTKYGAIVAEKLKFDAALAARARKGNPLLATAEAAPPRGKPGGDAPVTLATLAAKGARFAVCGMATQGMAMQLAKATGAPAKAVEDELKAGLVAGAVIVPAGIVAVNRAQEHGYAFVVIGD